MVGTTCSEQVRRRKRLTRHHFADAPQDVSASHHDSKRQQQELQELRANSNSFSTARRRVWYDLDRGLIACANIKVSGHESTQCGEKVQYAYSLSAMPSDGRTGQESRRTELLPGVRSPLLSARRTANAALDSRRFGDSRGKLADHQSVNNRVLHRAQPQNGFDQPRWTLANDVTCRQAQPAKRRWQSLLFDPIQAGGRDVVAFDVQLGHPG